MGAALIVGVLAAWFVVSAVCQVRVPRLLAIRRFDPIGVIPRWNFFAPRPIVGDLVVQYRTWDAGEPGQWTELDVPAPRRPLDTVWPGTRRAKKAAFDASARTVALYRRHRERPGVVITSIPYLLLLGRVTRSAAGDTHKPVQFRIVRITYPDGRAEPVPIFRSAVHRG